MALLNLSFDAANDADLAGALQGHAWMQPLPSMKRYVSYNGEERPAWPESFAKAIIGHAGIGFNAVEGLRKAQRYFFNEIHLVTLRNTPVAPTTVREFFEAVQALPFEVGTMLIRDTGYDSMSIAGAFHVAMGPAIAFRGAGHDRICSPHLLGLGPWYVHRDEASDTTVIQFHADGVDGATAEAQAKRGHWLCDVRTMQSGRYLVDSMFATYETFTPVYDAARRMYRITHASGQRAGTVRMADANALRFHSRLARTNPTRFAALEAWRNGHSQVLAERNIPEDRKGGVPRATPLLTEPFEDIEFFYEDPADAYADLMELYVRGLPCIAQFPDGERRLDTTFKAPRAPTPDWVKALQDKHGA